jgi:hypothetical protein
MSIETVDGIAKALGNNSSRLVIDKASIANTAANQFHALWRATGVPGQGAIPAAAAVCTSATVGAMGFANQTAPAKSYIGWMFLTPANSSTNLEIHDRLKHMGGLSGIVTTAQGALDLSGVAADRIGDANFSDLQWWLEWYTDTGATGVTATVNVTYGDDTTGNVSVAFGATMRASRRMPILPAVAGKWIKQINSVQHATTGTAGNYGITVTRPRTAIGLDVGNKLETRTWADLGFPDVENDSCLEMMMICSTTSTGTLRGGGKIAHG